MKLIVALVGDVAHVTTIETYVSHVKSANNVRWDTAPTKRQSVRDYTLPTQINLEPPEFRLYD